MGYCSDEINVVMSEETRKKYYGKDATLETEVGNKAAEGAAIGGAVGSTSGVIVATFATVGTSLVLPGLGLVIAGLLAATIAGAGGVTAELVGAFIGWGIPEYRHKDYEQGINDGSILIGVKARSDDDARQFENEWKQNSGNHVTA